MPYQAHKDKRAVKLNTGWKYDLATLGLAWAWTDGQPGGDREVADWFTADGRYMGPNSEEIEPLFLESEDN